MRSSRSATATGGPLLCWLLVGSLLSLGVAVSARPFGVSPTFQLASDNQQRRTLVRNQPLLPRHVVLIESIRGGASTLVDSDDEEEEELESEDEEEEEEEEDEEDEEEETMSTLSASAVKAASKSKAKKTAGVKEAIKTGLADTQTVSKKKKKSGLLSKLRVPYIIKAALNPMTMFAMTKAYWASLFNLDYLKKDQSQDLRSALEEKAKKATGGAKPKRKFKPGQAKSLSDLPPLNT